MNKLPWFTHDNDAHEDIWIQKAIDKFGHFGYAAYFILIELLDRHGTGDSLVIPRWKLAQKLRSRWPQVRLYLEFSRSSGKVDYNLIGDEVQLQIKKFRERQGKLKSKLPAKLRQNSRKTPSKLPQNSTRRSHPGISFGSMRGFHLASLVILFKWAQTSAIVGKANQPKSHFTNQPVAI